MLPSHIGPGDPLSIMGDPVAVEGFFDQTTRMGHDDYKEDEKRIFNSRQQRPKKARRRRVEKAKRMLIIDLNTSVNLRG